VHIWNLAQPVRAVDDKDAMVSYKKGALPDPLFTFSGHQAEGFGIDWCPTMPGKRSF
jgi:ribosome assembly protein RRB1